MTASGKHIIANAGIAIAGKIFGKAGFERFDSPCNATAIVTFY
jgi:hypothetical protein